MTEILYDNMAQWIAFGFFGKELEDMSVDEIRDNNEIIRIVEKDYIKYKLKPGYNEGMCCMYIRVCIYL